MKLDKEIITNAVKQFKKPLFENISDKELTDIKEEFSKFLESNESFSAEEAMPENWDFKVEDANKETEHLLVTSKENFRNEYLIFSNEETVFEYGRELFKTLWDDMGMETVSWDNMPKELANYVNMERLKELTFEDRVDYFENGLSNDEQREALEELGIDPDKLDDIETAWEYATEYINKFYKNDEDFIKYWEYNVFNYYTKDDFSKFLIDTVGIDIDKIYEDVESTDGLGHLISSYDGQEYVLDKSGKVIAYVYRIN